MKNLYDQPKIYQKHMVPHESLSNAVTSWLATHRGHGENLRLLDPACGTGFWLRQLAPSFAFGNDINSHMIDYCSKALNLRRRDCDWEFHVGDMRDLGPFVGRSINCAINLEASIGLLPGIDDVERHLRSMSQVLEPGGIYFLGCRLATGDWYEDETLQLLKSIVGDEEFEVTSNYRDGRNSIEELEYTLSFKKKVIWQKQYQTKTFSADELKKVISSSEFAIEATYWMELEGFPEVEIQENLGDVTMVLRSV